MLIIAQELVFKSEIRLKARKAKVRGFLAEGEKEWNRNKISGVKICFDAY